MFKGYSNFSIFSFLFISKDVLGDRFVLCMLGLVVPESGRPENYSKCSSRPRQRTGCLFPLQRNNLMAAAAVYKGTGLFRAGDYATVTALFTAVCLHFLLELIITVFYVHRTQDVTFEGLDHWRSIKWQI